MSRPLTPDTTTVIVGFTHADSRDSYVPFLDGYRPGAPQDTTAVTLPTDLALQGTRGDLCEALFVATNAPANVIESYTSGDSFTGQVITELVKAGVRFPRSLSVGDTVTVDGVTVACVPDGWTSVRRLHGATS